MNLIRELFYLRKSDRKVILALLCVIVMALAVILLTGGEQDTNPLTAADSVAATRAYDQPAHNHTAYYVEPRKTERFFFDPNTADSTQLLRLGLQPWQVSAYTRPEDFARLYGLTRRQYQELKPYIRLSPDYQQTTPNQLYAYEPIEERDTIRYPIKIQPVERVSLNKSDTLQLRKVPGIGSHFAAKIVEYRKRLGGFYSINQLLEIEDFPETAVHYFIIPDDEQTRKLNINQLSLNELKRHPYINFYQAKAITDYRRLHGPIRSLSDLSLSRDFPQEAIDRLLPYVEY